MKIIHFDEIDSTNAYVSREIASLENFAIVEADYQTAGKGREDRTWISPKKECLMFSIVIKDKEIIKNYNSLSMMMANEVRKALVKLGLKDNEVKIKWPNDVYVNDKKICGILLQGKYPEYLVVGIGININQMEFKGEYRTSPTSIAREFNKLIDFEASKKVFYEQLLNTLNNFSVSLESLISDVREYNYLLNKDTKYGKVVGIADDYSLVVSDNGKQINISTGEIDLN